MKHKHNLMIIFAMLFLFIIVGCGPTGQTW